MGVPALFRWLSQKYPKIVSSVIEEHPQDIEGQEVPIDFTKPNPNGEEFDNLYLDMNGIVHPCSHPEDRPPPETEEEMMLAVFNYTDRVVNMVRPRKVLLIAVDGVAPRAKMNQQRSRRFRSVQEAKEKDEDKEELLKMLKSQNGGALKDGTEALMQKKTWDSNAITPGTPFMDLLASCLRYWCSYKINTDPAWENVKVIISDATVPGEGEHKIMEFIRSQRSSPEHDPNTRHVIYGLDADLIMLGLATHEPHFRVLREDVFFQEAKARTCRICGQKGHIADECRGETQSKNADFCEKDKSLDKKPFIWLHVSVLREYLAAEMHVSNQPFRFDLERALDDWVFMCFFVGNDFLPHLPSLEIRENGIDTLIAIWRDNIPLMSGYLTKDGHVDLERAQFILNGLAKQEDAIFKRRRQTEERKDANAKRRKVEEQNRTNKRHAGGNAGRVGGRQSPDYNIYSNDGLVLPTFAPGIGPSKEEKAITHEMIVNRGAIFKANLANKTAAASLKTQLLDQPNREITEGAQMQSHSLKKFSSPSEEASLAQQESSSVLGKRKIDLADQADPSTPGRHTPIATAAPKSGSGKLLPDDVRLWEEGYADRYYQQKFGVDPKDIAFRNKVARAYVEGLAWVLLYYFQGCPSWTWYYPYHYAPFAADFVELDQMKIEFEKGAPFKPYEQLMGVLPAASNHAIPEPFRSLMTDRSSDILDFYPEEFRLDLNGKKFAWQGVAILPFIDEKRLLKAMATRYPLLSADEAARNEKGKDVLIISDRHPLYMELATHFYSKRQGSSQYKINPRISEGLAGKAEKNADYVPQSSLVFPLDTSGMPNLEEDHSMSVHFEMPRSQHIHKSMLLRGVKFGAPALTNADIEATKNRATHSGRSFGGAPFRGNSSNARGRGSINYADSRPNPFAAHIGPGFTPVNNNVIHQGYRSQHGIEDWRPPHQPSHNSYPSRNESYSQGYPPPTQDHVYGPPQIGQRLRYAPPPPYSGQNTYRPSR